MILLDLELILIEFNDEVIKESGLYFPGSLLTTNKTYFKKDIDTSNSIFRILILNESLQNFTISYTEIDPKEYFNYYLYNDRYYIPVDNNGENILKLTNNDISYITEVNNNNTNIGIEPDSDFLKAHKYFDSYKPVTTLGKIIKLCLLTKNTLDISKKTVQIT